MLSPQLLFCAALLAAAAEAFSPAAPLALRAAKPAALASTRSAGLGRVVAPMARAPPRRASHALAMAVSLPADTPLKVGIAGKESRLHIPIIAGASRRWPLCRWPQAYRSGRCSLPAAPRRACGACTHGAHTVRHGHRRDGCSRQGDRGCSRKARCVLCARLCHACTFLRSAAAVMPDAPEHSAGYSRACHKSRSQVHAFQIYPVRVPAPSTEAESQNQASDSRQHSSDWRARCRFSREGTQAFWVGALCRHQSSDQVGRGR